VVALPGHAVPWGDSEILWDGRNSGGKPVASGVYIYRVEARADDGEDQSDFAKCAALR
jgi:flagellar hook assembly protein FlgD